MRAEPGRKRRQRERLVALGVEADMLHLDPIARDDLDHIVRLVAGAVAALVRFRAASTEAPSSTTTSTRVAVATRILAGRDEAQVHGAVEARSGSHADHDAVGHEGGVELVDRIVARRTRPG